MRRGDACTLALLLLAGCGGGVQSETRFLDSCKTRPEVIGVCFRVYGTLEYRELREILRGGEPPFLVSLRPVLVSRAGRFSLPVPDDTRAEMTFPPRLRRDVVEAKAMLREFNVAGEFEICPLRGSGEGDAAPVCVERSANLFLDPR